MYEKLAGCVFDGGHSSMLARREVLALYDYLTQIDPDHETADVDHQEALEHYMTAVDHSMAWRHKDAYAEALKGREAVDRYHNPARQTGPAAHRLGRPGELRTAINGACSQRQRA